MIYDISLKAAGIAGGLFLLLVSLPALLLPQLSITWAKGLPRSRVAGFVLLTAALIWTYWLLLTMEMGEFSSFRRPLLFALPVGYILVLVFVNEFLAVRALGILYLLAAEPLLEAAFLRYEPSRLLVTVFAYILIVKGLFWVTMPYLMRDGIQWGTRTTGRWVSLNALSVLYAAAMLSFAFTTY